MNNISQYEFQTWSLMQVELFEIVAQGYLDIPDDPMAILSDNPDIGPIVTDMPLCVDGSIPDPDQQPFTQPD